jgi:hypothetical protein
MRYQTRYTHVRVTLPDGVHVAEQVKVVTDPWSDWSVLLDA